MFPQLFLKECKMILKSAVFYLYIFVLGAFVMAQASEFHMLEKPLPGAESYGKKDSTDKKEIMENTLEMLEIDWINNNYVTYPLGFYKQVSLDDADRNKVKNILDELRGKGKSLTYEYFLEKMEEVDQILDGRGTSKYASNKVGDNADSEKTYEEALKEYEDIIEIDHVSGAYARIFCDYLVLMLGILPVFLAVVRGRRDKRAQADALIYCKRASSISVVLSRYFAAAVMGILPVILFAISPMMQVVYYARTVGVQADMLLYLEYLAGWLLPTMLTVISVGFFFTELSGSAIGLFIQGIWWFIDINSGVQRNLMGNFGLELMPRWNTVGETVRFSQEVQGLITNRIVYSVLAVVLLMGTVVIYDLKRKGILRSYGNIFRNRKSKPEA